MVSYLCTKAVPLSKEASKPNYHEWSYRDILCLPESECKQWFKVCEVELDMLKQHKSLQKRKNKLRGLATEKLIKVHDNPTSISNNKIAE